MRVRWIMGTYFSYIKTRLRHRHRGTDNISSSIRTCCYCRTLLKTGLHKLWKVYWPILPTVHHASSSWSLGLSWIENFFGVPQGGFNHPPKQKSPVPKGRMVMENKESKSCLNELILWSPYIFHLACIVGTDHGTLSAPIKAQSEPLKLELASS